MSELNPHHPTTKDMHDHWHKIAALLLIHAGQKEVVITAADVAKLEEESVNIAIQERKDGLHVRLVSDEEASRLVKMHGGVSLS